MIEKGYLKERAKKDGLGSDNECIIAVEDSLTSLGNLAQWWRHQYDVRVAGITGSAGKTTTKEMAADILQISDKILKNKGNLNNLIGLPLSILHLRKSHRNVVMEMGTNHPGEIARLTEILDPDVGVITNVGMAHIEGLGSIDGVAKAKVELIERMSSKSGVVVNGDDKRLLKKSLGLRKDLITFGLGKKNDIRAAEIKNMGLDSVSFDLQYQAGSWPIRLRLPGIQNVYNALAASAVGFYFNQGPEQIVEGLSDFMGIKGRFSVTRLPENVTLVDDTYNANPLSLKAAIDSLRALLDEGDRVIVGLGEMLELGHEAIPAHREAGSMVTELGASFFIAIGDHAPEMVNGAIDAGIPRDRVSVAKTRGEMIRIIKEKMRGGDFVFLKGSRKVDLGKVADVLKKASE